MVRLALPGRPGGRRELGGAVGIVIYHASPAATAIFALFVAITLGLSFYLGAKTKSAQGYFAAGGRIHWFVNGVAFAGDYLSAASFLGICGMIAFYGYDGFLYSVGYLAGWVVALFVVAEPLKRLGRYTFADALDNRFRSRGIKLAAAASTLVVSLVYLIPQMVGAGALVRPLLGLEHWHGVIGVGTVVVLIVVTAGMVSTTYVQFLKGSLLVLFSAILTVLILSRGLQVPSERSPGAQTVSVDAQGRKTVDGKLWGSGPGEVDLAPIGRLTRLPEDVSETGPLGPLEYLATLQESDVELWSAKNQTDSAGRKSTVYQARVVPGKEVLRPGNHPTFAGIRGEALSGKMNFLSLMLALFGGTASLPHILIRYYTVKDQASARKSTLVGIGAIGLFYILTLYIGLGAMTCGAIDVTNSNMAAPLLARSFGEVFFAMISAIAFTTVLGTVAGLIVAASGAVVHDLMASVFRIELEDRKKVLWGKIAAVFVGVLAMALGMVFETMNVTYLVAWAFAVAASANLPSLVMLLFWKGTTRRGIIASITVGLVSSVGWIMASGDIYKDVYGLDPADSIIPFSQPGIVTIPLSFLTLVVVSLVTREKPMPITS